MSLTDLSGGERAEQERALPQIWGGTYDTDRISWYTRLIIDHGGIRGGCAIIPEFVAAMICESALDNLTIGNNAKTGSRPMTDPRAWSLGVSWCQLDTLYHVTHLDGMHALRRDPLVALEYVTDPVNGLCSQGGAATHFNKAAWHAWTPEKIDPAGSWSPLKAAQLAYQQETQP